MKDMMKDIFNLANGFISIGSDLANDIAGKELTLQPVKGSVIYCNLGMLEHSGIYIGNNEIIHLDGDGCIMKVSPEEFTDGLAVGENIYLGCRGQSPVGNLEIASRAIKYEKEISTRSYNLLFDNCHQFTSACINGNPENTNNFFWMLSDLCKKNLSVDTWCKWDYQSEQVYDFDKITVEIAAKESLLKGLLGDTEKILNARFEHMKKSPSYGSFFYESRQKSWEEKDEELEVINNNINSQVESLCSEIESLKKLLK